MANPSSLDCLREGFTLMWQPGLRGFVIAPLLINSIVLFGLVWLGVDQFDAWLTSLTGSLPGWLAWLESVLWFLFVIVLLAVVFYGFTMIANIIAAPFNALLALEIEARLGHEAENPDPGLVAMIPRTIAREFEKIRYILPRLLGLVVLSFIPGVNVIAAPVWVLFGAWMMAAQYADYAADNNGISFRELRARLVQSAGGRQRGQSLAFGLVVYFALAVPAVNLLVLPAAVAGGTVFYVRRLSSHPVRQVAEGF